VIVKGNSNAVVATDDARVKVTATDSNNFSITVDNLVVSGNGTWETLADTPSKILDVSTLADGTITISAQIRDKNGNVRDFVSKTTVKHTVQIDNITAPINDSNKSNITVSGVGEEGATVTVEVTHGADTPVTSSTVTVTGGTWSVPVDVSGLGDGTLSFKATADDGATPTPHTGTSTKTAVKDTVAPSTFTTSPVPPATVTAATAAAYALSGTTENSASIALVVKDTDAGTPNVVVPVFSADATTGAWSKTVDLSSLSDGTLTFEFTVTDLAGNSKLFSVGVQKTP
jgi:hypothetical protein